jgi:hypothetical protein
VSARRLRLSFYPRYTLYEIGEPGQPPLGHVIRGDGVVHPVDWTNQAFYTLNPSLLELTDDTVADYVRVFFRFVRGRHGQLHIVETLDDVPFEDAEAPVVRTAIEPHLAPLTPRASLPDGTRVLEARFVFQRALISAVVKVAPGGEIQIEDEQPILDAIPPGETPPGTPPGTPSGSGTADGHPVAEMASLTGEGDE